MNEHVKSELDRLSQIVKACPWHNVEFYKEYLAQSYHYVFYSTRMLAMAAANCTKDQKEYYKRSIQHIKEESGHEALALADLKNLGSRIEDFPELGVTRALWEAQFYKIGKQPTSLLGYILGLEGVTVWCYRWVFESVLKAHGKAATHFIRVHADEDPDHVEKCLIEIDRLSESEREAVWKNFDQTVTMFGLFLKECEVKADERSTFLHRSSQAVQHVL